MLGGTARALVALSLASVAALIPGCSGPPTAIVVVVESDLGVPGELASVLARVGTGCVDASCTHAFPLVGASASALPFSFTVTPRGDEGPLRLSVVGRDASEVEVVSRDVASSFVHGRTLLLRVRLDRACVARTCGLGETCIAGACASASVDPATLSDVVPGTELDGGAGDAAMARDAATDAAADAGTDGAVDGSLDAAADTGADGAVDTGASVPRSCAELGPGAPSGPTTIDPDGLGGAAPFVAYCETSADGGGWTLLAKADPATATMAFESTRWTDASADAGAFGTADLSVGDALSRAYWSLPVGELRIVMAPAATPTATTTLVTAFTPSTRTTLRAAMESTGHVRFDTTAHAWRTLVGASAALGGTTCETAGVTAELPESAPSVRVRIGYVWSNDAGCASPAFWAGIGATGTSCHAVTVRSGAQRLCGTGAQREDLPRIVWLFGR